MCVCVCVCDVVELSLSIVRDAEYRSVRSSLPRGQLSEEEALRILDEAKAELYVLLCCPVLASF